MLFATTARAELRLGTPFGDGMVVQRDVPVPIWGRATPGESVRVDIGDRHWDARADAAGKWRVDVGPVALGEAFAITIASGTDKRELKDVLAGEVWLCTGQSNMAATMRETENADAAVAAADFPKIRTLRIPEAPAEEPWDDVAADWVACTPATAMRFSGTAYYFGRRLHRELDGVPVGLIVCAWGGSGVVAWTSRDALDAPAISRIVPRDVLGWRENVRPALLYNGMLSPIVGVAARGVVWYQGETEGDPGQNAFLYRYTFPAMIADWRRRWARPELPFYFVQLPNIKTHPQWPIVRESQAAALALPRTGMITTIDIGRTDQLHPANKQDFGERLAGLVLAREYGKAIDADGPRLKSATRDGASMRVALDHAAGLKTTDGKPPMSFAIAGADRQFVDAEATLDGDAIVVRSAKVAEPVAVRYAWATDPKVNVANAAGLPLAPFRTDDWPLDGQEMDWQTLASKPTLADATPGAKLPGGGSGWKWSGTGNEPVAAADRGALRLQGDRLQLVTSERPPKNGGPSDTPAIAWTRDVAGFDPTKGCTAEVRVQVVKYATPLTAGIELAVTVPDRAGKFRRYRIAAAPMRLYGFTATETLVLGANLNNAGDAHPYRLAVRPDGAAQVYLDGRAMGVLAGESVDAKAASVEVGKRSIGGGVTATVEAVAIDTNGPYAP